MALSSGLGVLGLNPLAETLLADVLWASVTLWLTTGLFITAHDSCMALSCPNTDTYAAWVGRNPAPLCWAVL